MARVVELVLGILAAVAVVVGAVIVFAGEDEYLSFAGVDRRVGDIAVWWGYALLIAGIAVLAVVAWAVVRSFKRPRVHG